MMEKRRSSLQERLEALYQRASLGVNLGVGPTRAALAKLGDPHAAIPCVHVTGSNGKGSACAMIESIARAAGLRTGLYTSPHLCRLAEVIRLDGESIADTAFEQSLSPVLGASSGLTFFEALTVTAFHAFREARVDLAVIEVGLGGARDATNVLDAPLVTAITSVALEHTAVLGGSIELIAREKAGIFKPRAPIITGPLVPVAAEVVAQAARERGAGPIWRVRRGAEVDRDAIQVHVRGDQVEFRAPSSHGAISVTARLGLDGPHQVDNAAVASGVAWRLADRWPAVGAAIEEGLSTVRWPGRLERINAGGISVLFDCAHNPHGIEALVRALPGVGCAAERTILVFGALQDKPWRDMLAVLVPFARRRIYATPLARAAASVEELSRFAPGEPIGHPGRAIERALSLARPGDTVLITGSIYLVGEGRALLLGAGNDPAPAIDLSPRNAS